MMASTLEQLLSIQGAIEQQTMEQLMEAPQGAQEPAEDQQQEKPHPAAGNAQEGPSVAQESAPPPQRVEIKQVFPLRDSSILCELYKAGRVELLEKLRVFKGCGAVYAHFMLSLEDAAEAEKRSDTMKNDQKGP